jgi:transposase
VLAGRARQQGFFDTPWCAGLLAENSIYALLARHGDQIVGDEDFAECGSERWGRPSMAPSLLAEVLLLAYRNGLSDRRAMEALRFDLRWKVVLDLPIDHPEFHHTSLLKFRARLLLHGKERIVFERSLELATELGLLAGSVEQIIDSTPMLGAAAIQDTVTLRPRRGAQADRRGQGTRPGGGRTAAGGAGLRLRTSARETGRRTGTTSRRGTTCWSRSPATRSERCEWSAATTGWWATRRSARRRGCCARSAARSSRSPPTRKITRRVHDAGAARGRSSRPMTPRCVTAARPTPGALPATSCTSPRPPRRRC